MAGSPTRGGAPLIHLPQGEPTLGAVFPASDWQAMEARASQLRWERQLRGDIAAQMLELCASPRALSLYQRLASSPRPLMVRRAQVNRMGPGDTNGLHRDRDDDPDYTLAVVLLFTDPRAYDGGALLVEGAAPLKAGPRALVAFGADLSHALTPVTATRQARSSLILLLGEHTGPNRRFQGSRRHGS